MEINIKDIDAKGVAVIIMALCAGMYMLIFHVAPPVQNMMLQNHWGVTETGGNPPNITAIVIYPSGMTELNNLSCNITSIDAEQAVLKMSWFVAPNMTLGQFNQMAEFIYQELVIAYQRTAL